MKLSSILEAFHNPAPDPERGPLYTMSPDSLSHTPGCTAFIYSGASGLLVAPEQDMYHATWMAMDDEASDAYERPDAVSGRFNPDFQGTPVVCMWGKRSGDFKTAARALLGAVPKGAVGVINNYAEGNVVQPLEVMAGLSGGKPARGHQYWQTRQTSEGRVR